jgi:hypothetical protein
VSLAAGLLVLARVNGESITDMVTGQSGFSALFGVAFPLVGAFIAWRLPRNPVGWILIGIGQTQVVAVFAGHYVDYARARPSLPLIGGLALIGEVAWAGALPLVSLLLLLFPHGRLPSRRWRPVVWLIGAGVVLFAAVVALAWPTRGEYVTGQELPSHPLVDVLGGLSFGIFLVTWLAALVGLVIRFHRSRNAERQQMKWFTYAAGVVLIEFLATDLMGPAGAVLTLFLVPVLPAAIAIAIFRYRLYDIDLVINRTLVYGALTVLLGTVYVAGVVGLPRLLPLEEDNDLLVAGSTLAVAALFSPLRRRTQAFVDRRFYRHRYNAQQTVEAFAARLRNEVDLGELSTDLVGVVRETFQPAHVSVWLRKTERAPR